MGKHLVSSMNSTVQFHDNHHHHPGCMWGILHILDYHHWHHNIRNVFPIKKHYRGAHVRYKRKSLLHSVEEAEPLLVRQHGKKWSTKGKSYPKSSNEGSHTKNRSKESKHLKSSHKFVKFEECDTISEALHLEKLDEKITEASVEQKLITETKKLNRDTQIKSKRHGGDVLEVLGVEKDLLLKFLLHIDVCEENLQLGFNNKARLTKSGSVPQRSQMRSISPVFLEHKQKEIWPFHKEGKLLENGAQAQKIFASYVKPMALGSEFGLSRAMKLKHKQSFSSSTSSQGLNHKGWNQVVLQRFKVIKSKIKHAIIEFRNSGYQTSVEAINHRALSQQRILNNGKEISQILDDGATQKYRDNRSSDHETKASDYDSSIHEVFRMKKASSLNDSLDRYTRLFEQSFNKDMKWHSSKSKSLKLPNEEKNEKSVFLHNPKASRRNLSLPNLDSFGFFILHEALSDANDAGMTVEETDIHVQRKSVSIPLNRVISLGDIAESEETEEITDSISNDVKPSLLSDETMEKIEEGMNCDYREDTLELVLEDGSFSQEEVEISVDTYPSIEAMANFETTSCESNKTMNAEGRESNVKGSNMEELESDLPNRGSLQSLPCSLHNTDPTEKGTVQIKSDTDIDSNFKYVKDVLESLDFKGNNEDIQMWHTLDFDGSWGHEIEFSAEEETLNNYHLLLSNLVKEILLKIHETSKTYFPRHFSFNRCISPMDNKGYHLVNEVWNEVNSYLSLRPELDQTLDDVVGRDMAKNSGWMNLQHEEECVALALEDMIVKDLLEEIIFT